MLSKLIVNNVALVKSVELDFCNGLNILSGETGAGKSIIVDSLMLLLGSKYDKTILRYGEESGFVEGVFENDDKISGVLAECGFAEDDILIVNRKFNASTKNEIRVNGRVCSISMLKEIMSKLVDIYGQNEYQSLTNKLEQKRILDFFLRAELEPHINAITGVYKNILSANRELKKIGSAGDRAKNVDIIKFQLQEIAKANVQEGEEEELVEERNIIASAEKIATAFSVTSGVLSQGEGHTASSLVDQALDSLCGISDLKEPYNALYEQLRAVSVELGDIASTCESELSSLDFDGNTLEKLEQRLEVIRTIKRKYGSYEEVQKFVETNTEFLDGLENADFNFEKLTKQKNILLKEYYDIAVKIKAIRKKGAISFEKLIVTELADLGMAGAEFKIGFNEQVALADTEKFMLSDGLDKIEFYFSANKGQPCQSLTKIISGGELSRFMLALKTVSSKSDQISTMIFDEIDTGISGKIGQEVAKKLAVISSSKQVLCVTHLSQIASMADNHYFIEKSTTDNVTTTSVTELSYDDQIEEISRLSGAKDVSNTATDTAKELKKWSTEYKSKLK